MGVAGAIHFSVGNNFPHDITFFPEKKKVYKLHPFEVRNSDVFVK